MTIRRRLFLSNILMIVLPAVICMLAVCIISGVVMQAFGISRESYYGSDTDFFDDTRVIAASWTSDSTEETIALSLTDVVEDFPRKGASLTVYRDGEAIWSYGAAGYTHAAQLLGRGGDHVYTVDGTTVMTAGVGAYTLVGTREDVTTGRLHDTALRWRMLVVGVLILACVVAIILMVNSHLTRMNFRHIIRPLETLSDGVRHIADGNLATRIDYAGRDEFAPVIDDFNDMAARLQAMVAARQKDDESRRELIAGISHDLRTPLTSIIGYVEGLEKGVADSPEKQARYLAIIHEQAEALSHTINQLFLFTKLDTDSFPMRMERIDLAAELRAYVESVAGAYAERGMTVALDAPDAPLWVRADRVQLRNVFTNILENSVKCGNRDGGRMEICARRECGDAVVTLADDGPGVPDAVREKLLTVFYRGDASRRNTKDGSGLGLAISARIIQRLGGTIRAEDAVPHGLAIRLTLPIAEEEDAHAAHPDH